MAEFLKQRVGLKTMTLMLTGSMVLAGCSIGPDDELSDCPRGWRTDLEVDAGIAIGVLGAIGQQAMADATPSALTDAFTDTNGGSDYGRNNADQIDEVACSAEDESVVLNPHGAVLVRVAQEAGVNLGALSPLGEQLQGELSQPPANR